jgi:N-acetylmuramoyl-L-alanine amidase
MRVAVFAGHTGKDSGAINPPNQATGDLLNTFEIDITGPIARKVVEYLTQLGIEHILCFGGWEARLRQSEGCTVGIDIHADNAPGTPAQGFHVCYYPSRESRRLAVKIDEAMNVVAIRNRAPHPESKLKILNKTKFPTALLECGFLSSVTDEVTLLTEKTQWKIALAIVWALLSYEL